MRWSEKVQSGGNLGLKCWQGGVIRVENSVAIWYEIGDRRKEVTHEGEVSLCSTEGGRNKGKLKDGK